MSQVPGLRTPEREHQAPRGISNRIRNYVIELAKRDWFIGGGAEAKRAAR